MSPTPSPPCSSGLRPSAPPHPLRRAWTWLVEGTSLRTCGRLEGFLLRLLFAFVVWRSLEAWPAYPTIPFPVGMARWTWLWETLGWDLTRLADPAFRDTLLSLVRIGLALYVFGIAIPVALVPVAFVHIAIRTLNNSQGAPHHGYQMVSLVLLAQLAAAWVPWIVRLVCAIRRRDAPEWTGARRFTWVWRYSIAAAAATYVASVCSKLDESGGRWLMNSHYVAAQIVKTHRQNYYNHLDSRFIQGVPQEPAESGDPATDRYRHPVPAQADWLRRHPNLARTLFGAGFILELFAFLAVLGRRAALLTGLGLVSLHESIEWLMELTFPFNQFTVAVLFANAAGWAILLTANREFRPGVRVWIAAALLEATLFAAALAVPAGNGIAGHLIHSTQTAGSLLGDILRPPAALRHVLTFASQTVLFAALAVTARSLAADVRNFRRQRRTA